MTCFTPDCLWQDFSQTSWCMGWSYVTKVTSCTKREPQVVAIWLNLQCLRFVHLPSKYCLPFKYTFYGLFTRWINLKDLINRCAMLACNSQLYWQPSWCTVHICPKVQPIKMGPRRCWQGAHSFARLRCKSEWVRVNKEKNMDISVTSPELNRLELLPKAVVIFVLGRGWLNIQFQDPNFVHLHVSLLTIK